MNQLFPIYLPVFQISWWKNVNKKGETFFVSSLQYCQFEEDDWKIRAFFIKDCLKINLQSNI